MRWVGAATVLLVAATANAQTAPEQVAPGVPPELEPAALPVDVPMAPPASERASDEDAPAEVSGTEEALTEEELHELGLGGQSPALDTSLRLNGFMDFSAYVGLMPKDSTWYASVNRHQTFYIGNWNIYLSKALTQTIRTFGEVRFLYLPNGSPRPENPITIAYDTSALDYASFSRPLRWGGIEIERAYLEWTAHRYLMVRAGQFLTPYGIWNVDHGTPTLIPVQRPYVVGTDLFPERQTGLELFGVYDLSPRSSLGYHLTVSNGSGPISEYRDLDRNKAIGARTYWDLMARGNLRAGASIYYGRDTSAGESAGFADSKLKVDQVVTRQYDVLALAADLRWTYEGWHVQAEFISQQRRFTRRGRDGTVSSVTGTFIAPNDDFCWGTYGLLGYRFSFLGVMPYVLMQYVDWTDPANHVKTEMVSGQVGLNIRPVDVVVLKLEYTHSVFPHSHFYADEPLRFMQFQLAWAF